ncbi:MAG: 30S ribosomal protein S12 methylthiotransferase RimO [Syntrophorhabdaceae bacterium]|nr:30S ribosomal protein S12 methylthiotransferase RimO [Syntrophorhabdaceae bacterium]
MKFRIISLGCPKNLVESEYITKRLEDAGHTLSEEGDTVVINTCAFISDAARESIETIIEAGCNKEERPVKVVVTGCLVERFGEKLKNLLPEVDLFVGRNAYGRIEALIEGRGFYKGEGLFSEAYPKRPLTKKPTAYLKIQEGCNNRCSYCAVPMIRGGLVSRPIENIKKEFEWLIEEGFREINIIGQDITSYGIKDGVGLKQLLSALLEVRGDYHIRLLYLHPKGITDELIDIIAREERIIKYIDMPIQHSEDHILSTMGRGYKKRDLEDLLEKIRNTIPDAVLRTTVIVGFPGETEEDFLALCDSIEKWQFDMLGAFMYSKEEKTVAASLKNQIKKPLKQKRYERIMALQGEISKKRLKRFINRRMKVIVEEEGKPYMTGRLLIQAPDIDGLAFIKGPCTSGEIREGRVVKTLDYDVIVEL